MPPDEESPDFVSPGAKQMHGWGSGDGVVCTEPLAFAGGYGVRVVIPASPISRNVALFNPRVTPPCELFVAVFRPMRGLFREAPAVFLALDAALTPDGNFR